MPPDAKILTGFPNSGRQDERRAIRLVIAGAAAAIIVLWLAIAGVLTSSHHSAIEAERRVLTRMASVVEEQARHFFMQVQFFMVAADQVLDDERDPLTNPRLLKLVSALSAQAPGDVRVSLVSVDGRPRTVMPATEADQHNATVAAERQLFASMPANGIQIGMPIRSDDGTLSLPVSHEVPGERHGVTKILVSVKPTVFNELFESWRTKPNGSIALVHQNATVLARAPLGQNVVGKSILSGDIWQKHLPRAPNGSALLPAAIIDDSERLAVYLTLSDFPLVVITSSSTQDVLSAWQRDVYGATGGGLLLSFLILFGARRLVLLLTELSVAHTNAESQALRDHLTGLPNRRMLQSRLRDEINKTNRTGRPFAIMFIDLDLFKEVNDVLGHGVGDLLLKETAQRLWKCIRDTDTVARLGGDEFMILLCELTDVHGAERVAQEVLKAIAEPFHLHDELVHVSASIGITVYPHDGGDLDDLLAHADQAMYAAKSEGRNQWKYFTPSMHAVAHSRMRLLSDVRQALACDEFRVHYQPIVSLKSGRTHKAEALIRWVHPTRGIVMPNEFIPVVEGTELIADIGDWVFSEAARQVAQWRKTLDHDFQISVNKSPAQFNHRRNSVEGWISCLGELGLPGSSIAIEITEGLLLDATEAARQRLIDLADAKIELSLDDFGTGYSSLSYLKRFDIDYIKIDRSFVSNMVEASSELAICEAMIVMAHKLGLKVIAEGVETALQRDLLAARGCDYGQGYFFSRPVTAAEFEQKYEGFATHGDSSGELGVLASSDR